MIVSLLLLLLVVLLLFMAAGPLESLGWWRAEGADEARTTLAEIRAAQAAEPQPVPYQHYVVYLSGIGAIDGTSIPEEELPLVEHLREHLPDTFMVLNDVFPYAPDNRGLTAQRPMSRLWSWIEKVRFKNPEAAVAFLVNARNAIQLFVCADRRYGPTYNIGTAQAILRSLFRAGYRLGSDVPVTLLGWSGGGQIALGASWYLGRAGIPLTVVSLGGMLSDDYGIDELTHLWHFKGSNDPLQKLGEILFAGRWPGAVGSPWSRGLKDGRISVFELGPMQHNVKAHYFDQHTFAPDGRSYLEVSAEAIEAVLQGQQPKLVPVDAEPLSEPPSLEP